MNQIALSTFSQKRNKKGLMQNTFLDSEADNSHCAQPAAHFVWGRHINDQMCQCLQKVLKNAIWKLEDINLGKLYSDMLLRMARKKKKNLDSVESVSMSHCFRVAMDARLHHDAWTTSSVTWAYLADVWLPAAYMQTWEICTGQVGVQSSVTERMIWRVGRIHCWKKRGRGEGEYLFVSLRPM